MGLLNDPTLNHPPLKLQEKNKQNYLQCFPLFLTLSRMGQLFSFKVGSLTKELKSINVGLMVSIWNKGGWYLLKIVSWAIKIPYFRDLKLSGLTSKTIFFFQNMNCITYTQNVNEFDWGKIIVTLIKPISSDTHPQNKLSELIFPCMQESFIKVSAVFLNCPHIVTSEQCLLHHSSNLISQNLSDHFKAIVG